LLPPSLLYFAGGYVETSYGGQAGQALGEIEGACQKVKRQTRQYQPLDENHRYYQSVIRDPSFVNRNLYFVHCESYLAGAVPRAKKVPDAFKSTLAGKPTNSV